MMKTMDSHNHNNHNNNHNSNNNNRSMSISFVREKLLLHDPPAKKAHLPKAFTLAVLHETLGADEFKDFFSGPLYLDTEKHFFGPKERRMLVLGFLRLETWLNIYKSKQKGTPGNLKGDGTLLGGVFVVGPGDQGVLYEHREGTFGDHANTTHILEAVAKISKHV